MIQDITFAINVFERSVFRKKLEASSNANSSIGTAQSAGTDQKHPVRPMRVGDTVNRLKKGHRRQDSLQESIFTMTEKDLKYE